MGRKTCLLTKLVYGRKASENTNTRREEREKKCSRDAERKMKDSVVDKKDKRHKDNKEKQKDDRRGERREREGGGAVNVN